jgi:hypothetical protein
MLLRKLLNQFFSHRKLSNDTRFACPNPGAGAVNAADDDQEDRMRSDTSDQFGVNIAAEVQFALVTSDAGGCCPHEF